MTPSPKKPKCMIAVFEVAFDPDDMFDADDLKFYGNSWLKAMKWLYREEGLGIFTEKLKLVSVIE